VWTWRQRWRDGAEALDAAETTGDADQALLARIEAMLDDAPRSGSPGDFSAEQLAQIISVACEAPEDCGRPVTHCTPRELADEVIKRGIVLRISPRTVGVFEKEADLKPHRSIYWLNPHRDEDPAAFDAAVHAVCETYRQAPERYEQSQAHLVAQSSGELV
jgi:hypothetical protein